jgi:hypothetical protein
MANQSVSVLTPAGLLQLLTNENGQVRVNAAGPGNYVFTWNEQTVKTTVAGVISSPPPPTPVPPVVIPTEPVLPAVEETPAPTPAPADSTSLGIGLLLLVLVAVIAFLVFTAVLGPRIFKMLNQSSPKTGSGHSGYHASSDHDTGPKPLSGEHHRKHPDHPKHHR